MEESWKTAGTSHNELRSSEKIISEGNSFFWGQQMSSLKRINYPDITKNKQTNKKTTTQLEGMKRTILTFLLIKCSSSYGPLYTQIPVEKGLQDQACTKKKYTIITLMVLLLHNANQPGLHRRD